MHHCEVNSGKIGRPNKTVWNIKCVFSKLEFFFLTYPVKHRSTNTIIIKIDGVAPLITDSPLTSFINLSEQRRNRKRQKILTSYAWRVTREACNVSCDIWQVTHVIHRGRRALFQICMSLALKVWEWSCFKYVFTKDDLGVQGDTKSLNRCR